MTQLHFDTDIPFLWTALFHWLSDMLFITLLPKRMKPLPTVLLALLLLPVQIALYSVIAPLRGMAFNLSMTLFAIWTLVPFLFFSDIPFKNKVYYCARAFIIGASAVAFAWHLYWFYAIRFSFLHAPYWEIAVMLLLGGGIIMLCWGLERRHRKEMREMRVSIGNVIAAVGFALFVYILSSLSYTLLDTPFTAESQSQIFLTRTIVYLGGMSFLFAFHLHLCDLYARTERDTLQHILDQQYENYRVRQETNELIHQKYHDLKHQIALLRSEVGSGQKLEYLDRMEQEIRAFEAQNKTGNEVLDTILTGKSLDCQQHGIMMTVVADGHALDFMDVMDLSALFGNAIDNAIEAACQVREPEQRLVLLSVSRQKGFLSIRLKNRYEAVPLSGDTLPQTTKRDKRYHGYGLKSMQATAEKYGGSFSINGADGWFDLDILIPLPMD